MPTSGSPTVRRRRLAAELRRLREGAGRALTVDEVGTAVGWSRSKVSRYELAQGGLRPSDVAMLLDFYRVTDPKRSQLLTLAHDATMRGWWEDFGDVIDDEYQNLIGLEAEATSVSQWQIEVVPGLLQTESYARHVLLGYQKVVPITPGIVDRRVEVRMRRQEVLTRDEPLELSIVLDESILLRRIGGQPVMRAQLERLLQAAELPNVTLRVRPLSAEHDLVAASFGIFRFGPARDTHDAILHDVVHTESLRSQFYVEGEADTYEHRLAFQRLTEESFPPAESHELILQTAHRLWE